MAADPLFPAGERLPASKLNQLSPDMTTFTPTWTNVTQGTSPTNEGWYSQIGRRVDFGAYLVLGTGGALTGTVEMDLPVAPDTSMIESFVCLAFADDSAVRYVGAVSYSATTLNRFVSNGTSVGWNATSPFTWAVGNSIRVQGNYFAA